MIPKTLGVIGLGAVGGSVAWQATRAGVRRVLGFATDPKDAAAAARAGAVTEVAHDPIAVLRAAELVVFACPHEAVVETLARGADVLREGAAVWTDVASVKGPMVAEARRLGLGVRFAGSHPLVAFERSGFAAAHPERLRDRLVYVTPTEEAADAGAEVADFWERVVGAHPVLVAPERHDRVIAWTQLLPVATAAAVARVLAEHRPSGATLGPAALDATRPAVGDVDQVVEALLLNRDRVREALAEVGGTFDELAALLAANDAPGLARWLADAAAWRAMHDA